MDLQTLIAIILVTACAVLLLKRLLTKRGSKGGCEGCDPPK